MNGLGDVEAATNPPKPYFIFLPAIARAGLPAREFAVAEILGFTCLGFLVSLLPRLLLPLDIGLPSILQRPKWMSSGPFRGCGLSADRLRVAKSGLLLVLLRPLEASVR